MEFTKVNEYTVSVSEQETITKTTEVSLDRLNDERARYVKNKKDFDDYCDSNIARIDTLIAGAKNVGVKTNAEIAEIEAKAEE